MQEHGCPLWKRPNTVIVPSRGLPAQQQKNVRLKNFKYIIRCYMVPYSPGKDGITDTLKTLIANWNSFQA